MHTYHSLPSPHLHSKFVKKNVVILRELDLNTVGTKAMDKLTLKKPKQNVVI